VSGPGCPGCGCIATAPAHVLVASLQVDDVDRALDLGLLDSAGCPSCTAACTAALLAARDARRSALDARERFRARQRRLAMRAAQREDARRPKPSAGTPALPSGAAAALQRALARAASKR
jgi:hypothetical protein